jgi:hypothetical protein
MVSVNLNPHKCQEHNIRATTRLETQQLSQHLVDWISTLKSELISESLSLFHNENVSSLRCVSGTRIERIMATSISPTPDEKAYHITETKSN